VPPQRSKSDRRIVEGIFLDEFGLFHTLII